MIIVVFEAHINTLDETYFQMARQLRTLACSKYGCQGITSVTEGNKEITISYWNRLEDVDRWREDPVHRKAQFLGKTKWYTEYRVVVAEVVRDGWHTF